MESAKNGMLAGLISQGGSSITLRARQQIPIAFTHRKTAVGSDRSFNAQTTAARPGSNPELQQASQRRHPTGCRKVKAISLFTMSRLKQANRSLHINGMTAHRNHGSSNEYGISNLHSMILTPSMPALKMLHYSAQAMAAKPGRSFPVYAAMELVLSGSRVRAGCACTRLFWILNAKEFSQLSLLPVRFGATTREQHGNQLTRDCARNTFRIQPRRWATVCITLR